MLQLELESNIKVKFKKLIGTDDNKEIEQFIKDKKGIKEYSYYQVETFIKLYISQFNAFESKVKFTNSEGDITQKCIQYFAETTKYFTNGGFAKLIMEKKRIKNLFELCLDAYESDLGKAKFDKPLIFIDKETKKCKFERIPYISEEEKQDEQDKKYKILKDVDIVYIIDATGSMDYEINAAKEHVFTIFKELKDKNKEKNFQFGAVFYRDKVYTSTRKYRDKVYARTRKYRAPDKDDFFPLTSDIKDLEKKISQVHDSGGGGDGAEDWAGGYELALKNMNWRNGIKLIIHICDDGAHGEQFTQGDPFFEEGEKLISEIKECVEQNINIIGFKIGECPKKSFEKIKEIIMIIKWIIKIMVNLLKFIILKERVQRQFQKILKN